MWKFLNVSKVFSLPVSLLTEVIQPLKKLRVQTLAVSRKVSRAAIPAADMAASPIAVLNLPRVNQNLRVNQQVPNPSQSFQKPKRSLPLRRNG